MTTQLFLVVEDHPVMAEMICLSLKQLEPLAHCITAKNSNQAKERLKLEKPHLITVDLMFKDLGGKNSGQPGISLLKHIFQAHPQLNVLVYSTEPSLLQPIVKEAQSHQGSFVVVDKQLPPKDFSNKARMLLDNPGLKLIPSYLTKELESIKITDKEREVLELACRDCLTDDLIVEKLDKTVSKKTVQSRMRSVRQKLKISATKGENDIRMLMCNKAREQGLI